MASQEKALPDPFESHYLSVEAATERIIALHNEDPGEPGGYFRYHPLWPQKADRVVMAFPVHIGYVCLARGSLIDWHSDGEVQWVRRQVAIAQRERRKSTRTFPT